jgi:type VI secretion system protein ImpB
MPKEASEAPKERVNIVYRPATNMDEDVELPLKLLMVGDYTGRQDSTPLEERKPISVDKDNFNEVMRKQDLSAAFAVRNKLSGGEDDEIAVNLKFGTLKDFEPEAVARQVPELAKLLELREALVALKGPLGNIRPFVDKLRNVLGDDAARQRLMQELGIDPSKTGGDEGQG